MVGNDVFAALASPVRREVLTLLRDGDKPVHELAVHFDLQRPSVSEHLRVLLDVGLVTETRHGRERIYSLQPAPLRDVATWLRPFAEFWRGRLHNLEGVLADLAKEDEA